MRIIKKHYFIFAIILLISVLVSGCTTDGYQKIVETKQGVKFSFECPTSYKNLTEPEDALSDFTFILIRPDGDLSWESWNVNTEFGIEIYTADEEYDSAKSRLDDLLKSYSNLGSYHEFNLLERSKVEISGIEGELVVYTFRYFEIGTDMLASHLSMVREAYLDYQDQIWIIWVKSYSESTDQVKEEFDHIIKIFKFLD